MMHRRKLVLLMAIALDLLLGEPPNCCHPVAWMGSGISLGSRLVPTRGRLAPLAGGAAVALAGCAGAELAGSAYLGIVRRLPEPAALLAEAVALKTTFSIGSLFAAAGQVHDALQRRDLGEARRLLSWHLVSRDPSALDEGGVAAAVVESVAENLGDGIVAPLTYFAAAGLPAAVAYRFVNTADAMLGYHDERREWLGKVPARLDDLLNVVPSRLSAACLVAAAALLGEDAATAVRIWRRDRGLTASPNAGHPMSAAAGALGVTLEKPGHYRLGDGLRRPRPEDIPRVVRLVGAAVAVFVAALIAVPGRGDGASR